MSWVTIVGLILTLLIFIPLVWKAMQLIFVQLQLRERHRDAVIISLSGLTAWCKLFPEKIPLSKIKEYVDACGDDICIEILEDEVVVRGRKFPEHYVLFFKDFIIFD